MTGEQESNDLPSLRAEDDASGNQKDRGSSENLAVVPLAGPLPDFDLNNRSNISGNKRRNASANYLNIISSHLGLGGRPATPTSPSTPRTMGGNKLSKIMGRPLSQLSQRSHRSERSQLSQSEGEAQDQTLDPLPDTKKDLEIRLNYHLSELDRLFKCVQTLNEMVLEHQQKYRDVHNRAQLFNMQINNSIKQVLKVGYTTMKMRKDYEPYVQYHCLEVDRVAKQILVVKEQNGEEVRLPDVFRTLRSEEQWVALFRVGGRARD